MDTDIRVLGIASSSKMLLSESGVALDTWRDAFERCALAAPLQTSIGAAPPADTSDAPLCRLPAFRAGCVASGMCISGCLPRISVRMHERPAVSMTMPSWVTSPCQDGGGAFSSISAISLSVWRGAGCRDSEQVDLTAFARHLSQSFIPNAVIIDATASEVRICPWFGNCHTQCTWGKPLPMAHRPFQSAR